MKLLKLCITLGLLLCIGLFFLHKHYTHVSYCPGNQTIASNQSTSKHRVLMICTMVGPCGGGEIHALNLYKELVKKDIPTIFLIAHGATILAQKLISEKLPFYTCNTFNISHHFSNYYFSYQPGIERAISDICQNYNISIIQCNTLREIAAAHKMIKKFPIKVVYTHHTPRPAPFIVSRLADGIIGVNPSIAEMFIEQNKKYHLDQKITTIYPFFDEDRFLAFTPSESRQEFFKQNFNITIKLEVPIIILVGHFYSDRRKNQALLIKAVSILINQKKNLAQIVFAGGGDQEIQHCKNLAKELKIDDYVHFLGSTDKTPGIFFHSDINVLPSYEEAFGITVLEGALMKKPAVVSNIIGAANTLVLHNQTGLIFENNDLEGLVNALETLLENPTLTKQLGENIYQKTFHEFSNHAQITKILNFYNEVAQKS